MSGALDNETESKLYEDLFWSFCYELNEVIRQKEPMGELSENIALEKYRLDVDVTFLNSDHIILEYRKDKDRVVSIRTEEISLSPIFATGIKKYSIPMLFRNLKNKISEKYGVEFDIENSIKILESNVIEMDERTLAIRKKIEYGEPNEILDSLGVDVPFEKLDNDLAAKEFIKHSTEFEGVDKQEISGKRYLVYSSEDLNKLFIVGDGEDQDLFIHPINDRNVPRNIKVEKIRSWMGYDYDYDDYELEKNTKIPQVGDTIRVQGDMTLEKTLDLNSEEDALELAEILEMQVDKLDISEELLKNKFKFRFRKDGSVKNVELLPNIKERDIKNNKGVSVMSKDGEIVQDQQEIVKAKVETVNDNMIGSTEIQDIYPNVEGEITEIEDLRPLRNVGQQIDNHLIICDEAYEDPYSGDKNEPVSIIVPRETTFIMAHDEHGEEAIDIDAGRYEISLLDRV